MNKDYIPINNSYNNTTTITNTNNNNNNNTLYKSKYNSKKYMHKIFKVVILCIVFVFILLIVGFIKVELTKSEALFKGEHEEIFNPLQDIRTSIDYVLEFKNIINKILKENYNNKLDKSECSYDLFFKNNYVQSMPCVYKTNEYNNYTNELNDLIATEIKKEVNKHVLEYNVIENKELLLKNNIVNKNIIANLHNDSILRYKLLYNKDFQKELLKMIPFYKGSILGLWISEYIDNINLKENPFEVFIEDRIIIILSDNIDASLSLIHMVNFKTKDLINSLSGLKEEFINNYEFDHLKYFNNTSYLNEEYQNIKYDNDNKYHKLIEPIFSIKSKADIQDDLYINYKLKKGDIIYIPAYYGSKIEFSKSYNNDNDNIKLCTISFNSRSRILATLIQLLFIK